jgi:predicted transcriptional regulator YdeE
MKPTIVTRDQTILLGFSFFGDPFALSGAWTEENEIGRLWSRFMSYMSQHSARLKHVRGDVFYEVHVGHEETSSKGHFEIFVGVQVDKLEDVPVEMLVKIIPAGQYAVFALQGEEITSDWPALAHNEWLPGLGYQASQDYGFLVYDERYKGPQNLRESELDACMPVTRVDDAAPDSHQ